MAETFLSEIAGNILGKLALVSLDQFGSIWGVENELKRLEFTLSAIKGLLYDAAAADQQQLKSQLVKDWLEKLDDVLSDMDDVLDDFMTEHLRRKVEIGESKSKEVRNFFSSSNPIAFRVKRSGKIKKLRERLEDIALDRRNYQFVERLVDKKAAERSREQSHSFVRASDVIGRDHDKEKIVELLLSSASQDNNVSVLPIVGLGGLGKTTLAKFVYNDIRIVQNFEERIWVCVSDDFDLKKLLEKILTAYTGVNMSHLDLDQMQNILQSQSSPKSFCLF